MPTASEILRYRDVKMASFMTRVETPDIRNAPDRQTRDELITAFQRQVIHRLELGMQAFVGTGGITYGFFDNDENTGLYTWQKGVEAGSGFLLGICVYLSSRLQYLCEEAKACPFDSLQAQQVNLLNIQDENVGDAFAAAAAGAGAAVIIDSELSNSINNSSSSSNNSSSINGITI